MSSRGIIWLLLTAIFALSVTAQTASGTVQGVVKDASSAVVPVKSFNEVTEMGNPQDRPTVVCYSAPQGRKTVTATEAGREAGLYLQKEPAYATEALFARMQAESGGE